MVDKFFEIKRLITEQGLSEKAMPLIEEDTAFLREINVNLSKVAAYPCKWIRFSIVHGLVNELSECNVRLLETIPIEFVEELPEKDVKKFVTRLKGVKVKDKCFLGHTILIRTVIADRWKDLKNLQAVLDNLFDARYKYGLTEEDLLSLIDYPVIQEDFCSLFVKMFDNFNDYRDLVGSTTKERIKLYKKFFQITGSDMMPVWLLETGQKQLESVLDFLKSTEIKIELLNQFSLEEILKLKKNYDSAVPQLQQKAKNDLLSIVCILNGLKFQEFVLRDFDEIYTPARSSILVYALRNNKEKFLDLVTANPRVLINNISADKLLLAENVYSKVIDLDEITREELSYFSQLTIHNCPNYKLLDEPFSLEEFKLVIGNAQVYAIYANTAKKLGVFNLTQFKELINDNLLGTNESGLDKVAIALDGKQIGAVLKENSLCKCIGFRSLINLLRRYNLSELKGISCTEELRMMLKAEEPQSLDTIAATIEGEFGQKFSDIPLKYATKTLGQVLSYTENEAQIVYLKDVVKAYDEGSFAEKYYTLDQLNYQLDNKVDYSKEFSIWLHDSSATLEEFSLQEISDPNELLLYTHSPFVTKYSYRTYGDTVNLCILDVSHKLLKITKNGDCIAVAVITLTAGKETNNSDFNKVLFLENLYYDSKLKEKDRDAAATLVVKYAMEKSALLGTLLLLDSTYKNLGIPYSKVNYRLFLINNNTKTGRFVNHDYGYSNTDWRQSKRYTEVNGYLIK